MEKFEVNDVVVKMRQRKGELHKCSTNNFTSMTQNKNKTISLKEKKKIHVPTVITSEWKKEKKRIQIRQDSMNHSISMILNKTK